VIIDSHAHVDLNDEEKVIGNIKEIIAYMDNMKVDKACLMTAGLSYDIQNLFTMKEMIYQAECLSKAAAMYPGRFYPMIWLNPYLPFDFMIDVIKNYILNGDIIGVKLSVSIKASDKKLEPLAAYLEVHNIPLLYHTWYKTVQKFLFESDPSDIAILAGKFPALKILMAHLTGCRFRGVQDIKAYPNVMIDTSGSQPEDGYLEYSLNELGADRILFGSDITGRDLAVQLARIDSIDTSKENREKMLYKNAITFFEGRTLDETYKQNH